jgi:hypothetical protein
MRWTPGADMGSIVILRETKDLARPCPLRPGHRFIAEGFYIFRGGKHISMTDEHIVSNPSLGCHQTRHTEADPGRG